MSTAIPFSDRYVQALSKYGLGIGLCVGLDPVVDRLPAEVRQPGITPARAIQEFSRGVIQAIRDVVPVLKVQSACFERFGSAGVAVLESIIPEAAAAGLLVILDAKRGDIGLSAEHYAAAAVALGAHAITVNGYLGSETIEPFLKAGLGAFVLVRTSNPGGDEIQGAPLAAGGTVAGMMAAKVAHLGSRYMGSGGWSDLGAVVGATKAEEGASLRAAMPRQILLVPGYGAQGGTTEDIRRLRGRSAGAGLLVTASRSVLYAAQSPGKTWGDCVRDAAIRFRSELERV